MPAFKRVFSAWVKSGCKAWDSFYATEKAILVATVAALLLTTLLLWRL